MFLPRSTSSILCFLLCACAVHAENGTVKVPDSDNQWPMAGGPDGSWIVETELPVPTEWSVRDNQNIKWKQSLPAGGQSGIAVWGNKIFLTINSPLDVPVHADLEKLYWVADAEYAPLLEEALQVLAEDAEFAELEKSKAKALATYAAHLATQKSYQSASGNKKELLYWSLMWKGNPGRAFVKELKKHDQYINARFPKVAAAHKKVTSLRSLLLSGARGTDVVLYCMDANDGRTLWTQPVRGVIESGYNYGFSDSTTPCPMTDGKHVWVVNCSGGMACFTVAGERVWERTWTPTGGRPFNKQFDSILYGDWVLNVEPPLAEDATRNSKWNYLHAFDKQSGKHVWTSDGALTHYNTPVIGETAAGQPAVLIGRGGPHGVPERPVGLSLVSLGSEDAGQSIWDWESKVDNKLSGYGALSTQHWDGEKASWFHIGKAHLTIDTKTGEQLSEKPLSTIDRYDYDADSGLYVLATEVGYSNSNNLRHCNLSVGDHVYMAYREDPVIVRHNVVTGKTVHVEVPREFDDAAQPIWGEAQKNDGINSKGQRLRCDSRTEGSGFQKCFLGSPTMVGKYLFITNAIGMVYVIDTSVEDFGPEAIVAVNDLGERGKTWTVNSLSFANGKIYHRTMKEIICIGE